MAEVNLSRQQQERVQRIVRPLLGALLRTARYLTRHEQEAEDLAQKTVIKAMRHIDSFQDGTDAKAWLMTILRRTHIDAVRVSVDHPRTFSLNGNVPVAETTFHTEFHTEFHAESHAESYAESCTDAFREEESASLDDSQALLQRFSDEQIIEAIKNLDEEIRWTLLLADVEKVHQADVAKILGVPLGTVKSRLHRGRKVLREQLLQIAHTRGWLSEPEEIHQ